MTDAGVIDRPTLDRLLESFGGDTEFFSEMLDTFFQDSPEQLAAIQAGLESSDVEKVRRGAHSLKSNSANFGALALSARCRDLEMLAKSGKIAGSDRLMQDIAAGYEEARAELEAIRQGV